ARVVVCVQLDEALPQLAQRADGQQSHFALNFTLDIVHEDALRIILAVYMLGGGIAMWTDEMPAARALARVDHRQRQLIPKRGNSGVAQGELSVQLALDDTV